MFRKHIVLWFLLFSYGALRAEIIDTVCTGLANAIYAVDSNAGSTYSWQVNGGDIVNGNGTHKIKVNWRKQPGLFKISVSEHNVKGCLGETQHAEVWVRGNQFGASFPDQACLHDSVTIKAKGGIKYQWSNGATDSVITIKLMTDTFLKVIISDTVCGLFSDSFDVRIKAAIKPVMSITSDVHSVFLNQPINIYYNGNANDRVNWQINKSNTSNPFGNGINVTFNDTGEAIIKVISTNLLGCVDSSMTRIEIHQEQIFLPTAFTPNGDGLNDVFRPGGVGAKDYKLTIYNRWGQAVFTSNNANVGWDGTIDGSP
ncbi:MAG: gliding motility-associated C-terminal domain-containing protein, partial [Bacteroidota bacterium]